MAANGSKEVLFEYKNSRWAVVLRDKEDVKQKVKDYYQLGSDADVILQTYSKKWNEWINVQAEKICHMDKVRVIVVEKSTDNSTNKVYVQQAENSVQRTSTGTSFLGASTAGTTTGYATGGFEDGSMSGSSGFYGQPAFGQTQNQQGGRSEELVTGTTGGLFGATNKPAAGGPNFGAGTNQLGTMGFGTGTTNTSSSHVKGFGTTGAAGLGAAGGFGTLGQQAAGLGLGATFTQGNQNALSLPQQMQLFQQQPLALVDHLTQRGIQVSIDDHNAGKKLKQDQDSPQDSKMEVD